jgi:hypothetical protein
MHRAQILLEKWQFDLLKAKAEAKGQSVSALVREIVSKQLGARPSKRRAIERACGIIKDGSGTARNHDEHLYGRRR